MRIGALQRDQPPAAQTAARPPVSRPVVDMAAHDRGRALWAALCVECHGAQARGSDTGPNIIRTEPLSYDRFAAQAGSVLGPFLEKGHPTSSRKPSASSVPGVPVAELEKLRDAIVFQAP